jgi:hypothetical protein
MRVGSEQAAADVGPIDIDTNVSGVAEVVVFIDSVTVRSTADGWVQLQAEPFSLNLLAPLPDGLPIGSATLSPGELTQIRLGIDEAKPGYVVTLDGQTHPLVVPSGGESGLKIHGSWTVQTCETLTLQLDVGVQTSLHVHAAGGGDEWILNPVIHASEVERVADDGCQ